VTYNLALCYAVAGHADKATATYDAALSMALDPNRSLALADVREALAKHPDSATLKAAKTQLERATATTKVARLPQQRPCT